MADSLLNHSWPSFSRRWMKRWSFKRGSESKGRTFPRSHTVSASSYGSSPGAMGAEDEVFFGSMAEETEDNSPSPDRDALHSSTEDLLSLDSALQGSEYYKDLGLEGTSLSGPPGGRQSPAFASTLASEDPCHYLDESCICSCSSGRRGRVAGAGPEEGGEGASPGLARSGLDALEARSEAEMGGYGPPPSCPKVAPAGMSTWNAGPVLQVDVELLRLDPGVARGVAEADYRSAGLRLRSTSIPSPQDSVPSQLSSQSPEVSIPDPLVSGIAPPVLDLIRKDVVAPEQVLMVQQVLKELTEYHRKGEGGKADRSERGGTKVKRRLSNLRSRVTGSWQKDKGKSKDREPEAPETVERTQAPHGHGLARAPLDDGTRCSLCGKAWLEHTGPCGLNCPVGAQKSCRNLAPECHSAKPKHPAIILPAASERRPGVRYFSNRPLLESSWFKP
ncbi:hypothetical protein JRQ81_008954 [Phrynocephalus forsythii]|uniref:Uncharacterized protein n=1 Tax=Phrynocephalus forsythii TaxID=171643 RepID=A0A9Q0XB02_9SAUR|nr:hypothetical protein JRQ81_008954 [Phrynocephalus forsythii]